MNIGFYNKKSQSNPFVIVLFIILFILIMGAGLGSFINTSLGVAMGLSNLTGFEAFLLGNLMLWFVLIFIIAVLWWSR